MTTAWVYVMYIIGGFGITGGVHRFWSHRSYEAKWPLKIILTVAYALSGLNNPYDWVRDHRVHHKYMDTDADPYNSNRGFFFSHVGWLMMKKHLEVIRKGRQINMSDVLADPIFVFSMRHINPTESGWINGEGFHNYHHVFPGDYKVGDIYCPNYITTNFIHFFAKIGWAYNLKKPSEELVRTIAMKKGDGSYSLWKEVPYPVEKFE